MVKFLILVGSSENDVTFFAYSNYSLDYSENVNVDALRLKLSELVFRFSERRQP